MFPAHYSLLIQACFSLQEGREFIHLDSSRLFTFQMPERIIEIKSK